MWKPSWKTPGPLAVLAISLLFTPVASEAQELPEGVTPEMVEQGKQIFLGAGLCAGCHGEEAEGSVLGPSLVDGEWTQIDGSWESILKVIDTGVPEPSGYMMEMAPRGGGDLTDEQARMVAAYVWRISRKEDGG